MRGSVNVEMLNVRNRPNATSRKVGLLTQNSVVKILGENAGWYEIPYAGTSGFISSRYLTPLEERQQYRARINADALNVRDDPGLAGRVLGQISRGNVVDILSEQNDWLEIEFNNTTGYIHSGFVEVIPATNLNQGRVTTGLLNVREAASGQSRILGTLRQDTLVEIRNEYGGWYEIVFNGVPAFVSRKYLSPVTARGVDDLTSQSESVIPKADEEEETTVIDDVVQLPLVPVIQYPVSGSHKSKKVAATWNRYGALLESLSEEINIEVGCAVAVLCVESSGKGFEKNNQNRMIIRFENHKFWKYWGKNNESLFKKHFKYGLYKNGKLKSWLGHQWRESEFDDWKKFHGSQAKEWAVLQLARQFDDTAALNSISMGAPQIMGFHSEKIGYDNVQSMFEAFNGDIRYQIEGLFAFMGQRMIKALQDKDFVKFAGYYNGAGQKEKYGTWIQDHYDAFSGLSA